MAIRSQIITIFLPLLLVLLLNSCSKPDNIQIQQGYKIFSDTEIFFKVIGEGEPIIVIHGGPVLEHSYLLPHLKPLAKNYKLIFYDQRLSGRSSPNVDSGKVRLDVFVNDIDELRKSLGLDKVHIMAHSWGGLLAMMYAIKYPNNLHTLILLNSMPPSSELRSREERIIAQKVSEKDLLKRQKILQSDQFNRNTSEVIEKILMLSFKNQFYDSTLMGKLTFEIPEDYMLRSQKFSHMKQDLESYDIQTSLSNIKIPTLLVYGQIEPAATISGPILDSLFTNSKLVVFDNSGHFPFIEEQELFLEEVQDFLKNH